jgi:N-acyl-D-aspartate/D-glutamate deacylase
MQTFDLVIRRAQAVTASDIFHCDIGIRDGVIVLWRKIYHQVQQKLMQLAVL